MVGIGIGIGIGIGVGVGVGDASAIAPGEALLDGVAAVLHRLGARR